MYEVHIFEAEASVTDANVGPYCIGNRHAMLIFSRQAVGTEHDWQAAEENTRKSGWGDFSFQRAGTLIAENLNGKSSEFREAFEHALSQGCGIIVYRDPLSVTDSAPRTLQF
jgi:hypothetical protein